MHNKMTMETPVFGTLTLTLKSMDEPPTSSLALGYVVLEGDSNHVQVALWNGDEWRTRSNKAFSRPVVAWYDTRKANGAPII